eukprot:NODE_2810_length_1085_cov_15.370564_g2680_i0.p1 GENE.NODE_2810_length_1085_cov_15.370564_g2680_i0~~NODE_2810_length_1085_cov_15.370564_g2680_i0.p1  ORF type:complete len:360 (-),score=101.87 NODE_2810_length_1085_cov_15.370564_g2680_i0:4-1020(-)
MAFVKGKLAIEDKFQVQGVTLGKLIVEAISSRPHSPAHITLGHFEVVDKVDTFPLSPSFSPEAKKFIAVTDIPHLADKRKEFLPLSPTHLFLLNTLWKCSDCGGELARVQAGLQCRQCGKPPADAEQALIGFVSRYDLCSLKPHVYLNDSVIEAYLQLLATRNKRLGLPRVTAFSTQFHTHFTSGPNGFAKVKRDGGRRADVFAEYDMVFVPINVQDAHWMLGVINFAKERIEFYDSLGSTGEGYLRTLLQYLRLKDVENGREGKSRLSWLTRPEKEIFFSLGAKVPLQKGNDCGVFVCKYANVLAQGFPLRPAPFTADHMQYFRRRMVIELCCGAIL